MAATVSAGDGLPGGNLAGLVRRAARTSPEKAGLVCGANRMTWREIDARVDRAALMLRRLGVAPGDRVGLVLGNTLDFPVTYFGALRAGAIAVPMNTGYTRRELRHLLGDSAARAVVVTPRRGADLVELAAEIESLEHVIVAGSEAPAGAQPLPALLDAAGPGEVESVRGGDDVAVLVYTSGTSGRPKGAMLSHRALLANLQQVSQIRPPVAQADDVVLLVLPLFHIFGLNAALGLTAYHAATGVLVERFDPVDTLAAVVREQVTSVVGAPPMFVAWSMLPDLQRRLAGVRLLISGAAPLPAEVLRGILDSTGRRVFEGYGLTETSPVVTTTIGGEPAKPDCIGRPVPGVELRLLDSRGREVEDDDPGEIWVRGPNLFSGYWPDGAGGPDADGWWATGDVAFADEDGDLHLVDRRRDLILVSGFNVYPREVEEVLLGNPDIEEVAVIGVPHPYTGESVKALVVPRAGAQLSAADVIGWAARSLARFKCPTAVEFVTELPHTATGKVSKGRLRERDEQRRLSA